MSLKVVEIPVHPECVYGGETDFVVGAKTENSRWLMFPKCGIWFKKRGENFHEISFCTHFPLGFMPERFFSATSSLWKSVRQLARLMRSIENIEKGEEEIPSPCFPWRTPVTLEQLKINRDQRIQQLFDLLQPGFSILEAGID